MSIWDIEKKNIEFDICEILSDNVTASLATLLK